MNEDFWGPPISVYTKAQAVEDGQQVEVPEDARRAAGILTPAYITVGLWGDVEHVEEGVTRRNLYGLLMAVRNAFLAGDPEDGMRTDVQYTRQPDGRTFTVWAVIDGDGLTIMHPAEY